MARPTSEPLTWVPYLAPVEVEQASARQLEAMKVTPSATKVSPYVRTLVHDALDPGYHQIAWDGRDEFTENKARDLAAKGYAGFAMDVYGKGKLGKTVDEKMALMKPLLDDRMLLRKRVLTCLETVKNHASVDPEKIAAVGFCFGGLCALDLARTGEAIKGVVTIHGALKPPELEPAKIKAKVLALHGYDDPMVPPEAIDAFANEMKEGGADWQLLAFGNTMHAFTNPAANDPVMGTVYNPLSEKRALHAMEDFLKEIFSS